jgi:hypothetical protein
MQLNSLLRFPCSLDKRPLMPAWQRNAGHYDHSRWPLVGVVTGEANGFDVLDIDVEGLPWLANKGCRRRGRTERDRAGSIFCIGMRLGFVAAQAGSRRASMSALTEGM